MKHLNVPNGSPLAQRKLHGFDYSRLGAKPKYNFVSKSLSKTLQLKQVPKDINRFSLLYQHYQKFGNITNIQAGLKDDPKAALVTFSTTASASAAYKSQDAVLNNRCIQVFYYYGTEHKNKTMFRKERNAFSKAEFIAEFHKKKQQFLKSHIKQQKIILEKLKTAKKESERAALKKMLEDLRSLLDNCSKVPAPYTKSEQKFTEVKKIKENQSGSPVTFNSVRIVEMDTIIYLDDDEDKLRFWQP